MDFPEIPVNQKIKEAYFADAPILDLSYCDLDEIPPKVWHLEKLEELYLDNNFISYIPNEISRLKNLKILSLANNKIERISPKITNLENLNRLILRKNHIVEIPEQISLLQKLKILDLSINELVKIPPSICKMHSLQVLDLGENDIENVPIEVVDQGVEAIFDYFNLMAVSEDSDYLYEAKLVLVGRGGRGKTSLVRKLTIPNYTLESKIESTEGIDIMIWDLEIPLDKSDIFRFNLWDFGGQEKYDATHQFFLTERSLYFFLTDAREEENYLDFDYWLNVITLRSKGSPVIIIQNKIDERTKELPRKRYQSHFPNIHDFVNVSCADGWEETINQLKKVVKTAIRKLPQVGDKLPRPWVNIRKELETLSSAGVNYISLDEYVKICSNFGLSSRQATFLSKYYHDLGIIVHHINDLILRDTVIINPDWVVDGVYSVLDTRIVQENKGKFSERDLINIWENTTFKSKKSELLKLMRNYELCFQLPSNPNYNSPYFIAPELLPHDEPNYKPISRGPVIQYQYHYEFMPAGIITRFIVRMHNLIEDNKYWRYGVILRMQNNLSSKSGRAKIVEDYSKKQILISISGRDRKEFLGWIRMQFKEIHDSFHDLQFSEMIPIDPLQKYFKSVEEVNTHAKLRKKIFIWELQEEFDPSEILAGVREGGLNKTTLKRNVAGGEIETVLNDIYRVYSDNNIIIAQLGRLRKLKQEISLGIIDKDKKSEEENRLRLAILELIDEL